MVSRAAIHRTLMAARNPERARVSKSFFRTGKGDYGEGDRFIGVSVPVLRKLAREFSGASERELAGLLKSPWHEERVIALLILVRQYERGDDARRDAIYRFYLKNIKRVNNWDLVDLTAPNIVGAHLAVRDRGKLRTLARSRVLWERRIAVIATQHFIRNGEFDDTLELAELLLDDPHDLMHKATGWMLREVGKQDVGTLERFLDAHATRMPRTMLRYAIERLPERRRRHYLDRKG